MTAMSMPSVIIWLGIMSVAVCRHLEVVEKSVSMESLSVNDVMLMQFVWEKSVNVRVDLLEMD